MLQTYYNYDREKIMGLSSVDLLDYINTMLDNGYTLKKLCVEKGLRDKTIRARLHKCNAYYDQKLRRYVVQKDDDGTAKETLDKHYFDTKEVSDKDVVITMKLQDKHNVNTTQNKPYEGTLVGGDIETLDALRKAIVDLTEQVKTLNNSGKLVDLVDREDITSPPAPAKISNGFKVRRFESKAVSRSQKFYPEVLEALSEIKQQYPEYSLQLILNTLILEGIEKITFSGK